LVPVREASRVSESSNNPLELEKTVHILESSKERYMKVINELNNLFLQDKWGESAEVKLTVEYVGSKYLEVMESKILEASAKLTLFHSQQERQSVTSKVTSRRSSRSARSGVSKASSSVERQSAIAEAAAAQEQAQFDILIAEKEREQKELEAVEEGRCAEARAKHEHEIVVLKARMKAATAEAKRNAIEQMLDGEEIASESSGGNDMGSTRDGENEVHSRDQTKS
jgi:hypothetical protein